ncbi:MAG: YfiR family protein [Idiomarina sp.]
MRAPWSVAAALGTLLIVAPTSVTFATTAPLLLQSAEPTPAEQTEASQRLSRALFMAQMIHFMKWPYAPASKLDESAAPDRVTFCMLHQRPDETSPQLLTEAAVLQQRSDDAASAEAPRVVTFHHYSQLQLHLANDYCHVIYGDFAQLKDLPSAAIQQLNFASFTISDNLAFLNQGGIAALYFENKRVRLYLNNQELQRSDITLGSRLLQVSRFYPLTE